MRFYFAVVEVTSAITGMFFHVFSMPGTQQLCLLI